MIHTEPHDWRWRLDYEQVCQALHDRPYQKLESKAITAELRFTNAQCACEKLGVRRVELGRLRCALCPKADQP